MNLGIHESSVNEVVDLFRGIANSNTFPDADSPDITSIDQATRAAWEELYGEDELTWSDIRSLNMRTIWEAAYASKEFKEIEPTLQELISDLSKVLVNCFWESEVRVIGEDVIADMQNAVYARAVMGNANIFFEETIQAYKEGAWPCGWEGGFPSGRLLTFAKQK